MCGLAQGFRPEAVHFTDSKAIGSTVYYVSLTILLEEHSKILNATTEETPSGTSTKAACQGSQLNLAVPSRTLHGRQHGDSSRRLRQRNKGSQNFRQMAIIRQCRRLQPAGK